MEFYFNELEKLNEYQRKAVTSLEKYVILNAAVGSGKTTVLVHKVLYMHFTQGIPLRDMVVLTFTNRATSEMRSRIALFGEGLVKDMKYFGTFHSVARLILSESEHLNSIGYRSDFEILDNEAASELLLQIIEDSKLRIKYKSKLIKRIEEFRSGKTLYGVMKKDDDINELVKIYNEEKIKRNVMDFDDIINYCIEVLKEPINPRWIIVDEFQDTDNKQLQLINSIKGKDTNIFCIGDPNQVIYSWRNGTHNIFDEFRNKYKPREMGLPLNYRSTKTIIDAANSFLYGAKTQGTKDYGSKIKITKHHDAFNEACYLAYSLKSLNNQGVPYEQIAVLYRRQLQGELLFEVLKKEGVPCSFKVKSIFGNRPQDETAEAERGVNLLTLHASKGLEFSHVFIAGANVGNIPLSTKKSDEPEELRLFYVGITRAKSYLEISYLTKPSLQGAKPYRSTYISLIPKELLQEEEDERENIFRGNKKTISELMEMIRDERASREKEKIKKVKHSRYGEGDIIFEDEESYRVDFKEYGIKEFSKMFCPLTFE